MSIIQPLTKTLSKIREVVGVIVEATRYSFRFCWRNNKRDTLTRIFVSLGNVGITYMTIVATGQLVDTVVRVASASAPAVTSVTSAASAATGASSFLQEIIPLISPLSLFAGVLLVGMALGRLNWFSKNRWGQSLHFANKIEINKHRASLDVATISSKSYEDLKRRIDELPWGWQTTRAYADDALNIGTTIVSFLLFGAAIAVTHPWYAVIVVVAALPLAILEIRSVNLWWELFNKMTPVHKKRYVSEQPFANSQGFVQMQMFGQTGRLLREIKGNTDEVEKSHEIIRQKSVRMELFSNTVSILGLVSVALYAAHDAFSGAMSIGAFTVILSSARTLQGNIETTMSMMADQWNTARGVILIEKEFFGIGPTLKTLEPVNHSFAAYASVAAASDEKQKVAPLVEVRDVHFTYPERDKEALRGVSFTIKPGQKVAIVGKSGSGKSSLAALLARHRDPSSGAIFADDIDLRHVPPEEWAHCITLLTQNYFIGKRTIAGEIAMARPEDVPNEAEIVRATEYADFVEVYAKDAAGIHTQIGTDFGGREFSGGEAQRLALARVLYRRSPIIILDEPDAKLDPESARRVMDALFAMKDVTLLIITHHVSRAERCDHIILMREGLVVEQGGHEELMARPGSAYAAMYSEDIKRLHGAKAGAALKKMAEDGEGLGEEDATA